MTKFAFGALAALFLVNLYVGLLRGWGNNMYVSMTFHFLGGFFMAMWLTSFYSSEFSRLSQPMRFLVVVAMTVAVGVFWEMSEYIGNQAFTEPIYRYWHYHVYFMGDLNDTVRDLVMDTVGALLAAGLGWLDLFQRPNPQKR